MAIADYFLKVDGIDGESADDKHKNQIELLSFSWGSANQGSAGVGGGSGAGKVAISDFVVMKYLDKASPKLLEACTTGKHIGSVTLFCRKAGGGQQDYNTIKLTDVLVSGYTATGCPIGRRMHYPGTTAQDHLHLDFEPDDQIPLPLEEITLNFGKIEYEYREQDSKGGMKGPVKTAWDVKANKSS